MQRFRWAQCQLDTIATLRTIKAVRRALGELPDGLDDSYKRILLAVSKHDVEIVRRILSWLAFAILPVTLEELCEVVAIEPGLESIDDEMRLSSTEDILSLCSSLVNVTDKGHVQLAHRSVKDFLLSAKISGDATISIFHLPPEHVNHELAMTCLTYLCLKDFNDGPCHSAEAYATRLQQLLFTKHAAIGWAYYARAAKMSPDLEVKIMDFFGDRRRSNFMSWVQVLNADYNFKWDLYPPHATSLYYAASFGLYHAVQSIINDGTQLDAPGSRFGGTALHGAVLRCHVPVMKLLLEAGADPNRADFNRVTPLHTAVVGGDFQVIGLLLHYGASKNATDGLGETPLTWAERAGQWKSRDLLLGMAAEGAPTTVPEPFRPESRVWKRSPTYFPNFYGRRSGIDSSVVISVETCGEVALMS
jgi:hypothetical protein